MCLAYAWILSANKSNAWRVLLFTERKLNPIRSASDLFFLHRLPPLPPLCASRASNQEFFEFSPSLRWEKINKFRISFLKKEIKNDLAIFGWKEKVRSITTKFLSFLWRGYFFRQTSFSIVRDNRDGRRSKGQSLRRVDNSIFRR